MQTYRAAVITVSDKGARGERTDTSGPAVRRMLEEAGYAVVHTAIIPDDRKRIREELIRCADILDLRLIITTGGTGFSQRDVTPEASLDVIERPAPGLPEAMRGIIKELRQKRLLWTPGSGKPKRQRGPVEPVCT